MDLRTHRVPLLLVAAAVVVGGAGWAATDWQQDRATTLRESRRAAELATMRVDELLVEEASSTEAAAAALSRWHSRYKFIPRELNSADIVEYLEGLTRDGFEAFDLKMAGRETTPDFSKYTIEVKGLGRYQSLYHLIWHLENNREFYRVNNLQMTHKEMDYNGEGPRPVGRDLVDFSFTIEAYYGGIEGISAPERGLAPVPVGLLLPHETNRDIFAPLVRVPRNAPSTAVAVAPSERGAAAGPAAPSGTPSVGPAPAPSAPREVEGLEVERDALVLIIGDEAHFRDETGEEYIVRVGDPVVGGSIESIDARRGVVRARLGQGASARVVVRSLGDRPAGR